MTTGVTATVRHASDHLLTMQAAPSIIAAGVVDVADGRVVWAGPRDEAPDHDGPASHHEGLLMPGMVNTHAHSPMVLLRGAGEGLPVSRWLTEVMWPREGRLTPDDVRWGMTLGAGELLANGITTSHEMYFMGDAVAEAAAGAGLRAVVTPPLLVGDDLARLGTWQEQLNDIGRMADVYDDHPLVTVGVGPHSVYALDEEPLRAVTELAADRDLHVQIHVAEATDEDADVRTTHGMGVPAYLEHIGMLDLHVVAAHSVWMDDADIDLWATHDVGVAHCPMSNGKHGSGICRVTDLRAKGVPVGIATDGPSSHDRLDLFEEMRAAIHLARLRDGADAMGPADALTMVTREAAQVLGRTDLGVLSAGARADMVLVDTTSLGPVVDPDDLLTHLVWSGSPSLVQSVWVGGRQVVDHGEPTHVDVPRARQQVATRARRLAEET